MLRVVISSLKAWDTVACAPVTLAPGEILSDCRIRCNEPMHPPSEIEAHAVEAHEVEPYVVEFHSSGRRYACPLFSFQPRTQAVELVWVDGIPSPNSVAV